MANLLSIAYTRQLPYLPGSGSPTCSRFCRLMKKGGGIELVDYDIDTDGERKVNSYRVYSVPEDEYIKIRDYIRDNDIIGRIRAAASAEKTESEVLTSLLILMDDGTRVFSSSGVGDEVEMLLSLHERCGEPTDIPTGLTMTPMGVTIQPVKKDSPEVMAGESWKCAACGTMNVSGKFCTECGTRKME